MQTVTFAKTFPVTKGLETTYYEAGWTGEVTNEVAAAAKAAKALKKEAAGGSDQTSPKGNAGGAEG